MTSISFMNPARHCGPRLLTWPAVVCRRSAVAAVASEPRAVGACAPPEFSAAAAWPGTRNEFVKTRSTDDIYVRKLDGLTFRLASFVACSSMNCLGAGVAFTLLTWKIIIHENSVCRVNIGKCHANCKCYFPVQRLEKSHWVGQMITLCFMRAHCGLKCQFIIVWTSLDGYHLLRNDCLR